MTTAPVIGPVLRRLRIRNSAADQVLLELDLGRGVAETQPTNPLQALRGMHTPTLRTLVENLHKAAADARVAGLIATVDGADLTLAQSNELRAAIAHFRSAGKPTLAWSASFGELIPATTGYHLATAFDEVWLQPSGAVGFVGFVAEALFLRGAFDKLGVEPQFGQRHEYKSAADRYMRSSMSDAQREATERVLASYTDIALTEVATSRNLDPIHLRSLLAQAPVSAALAAEHGLVDHVGYRDEAYAAIRKRIGQDEPTLRYVHRYGPGKVEALLEQARRKSSNTPAIGVIHAAGPIVAGRPQPGPGGADVVGSETLSAALRAAGRDDQIRAVVLRIDSPGGSYVASDTIRREVLQLRALGKPVVASMASVAGSGGYFIAMPCTQIVANPATVTGSIGVLAGKAVLRDALDRIGVHRETIASGEHAAMFSSNRPFDDSERALLDDWLDQVYADFTGKAAADRGLPLDDVLRVAKGRIWSGADARELGLVDTLGGLEAALAEACRLASVDRDRIDVRVVPKLGPLQALLPQDNSESAATAVTAGPVGSALWAATEGPRAWQQVLPALAEAWGIGTPVGVLSMPAIRMPGLMS